LSYLSKIIAKSTQVQDNIGWVFVYGTLMNLHLLSKILKYNVGEEIDDSLSGYKAISVDTRDGEDFRTLIKDKKDNVLGKRFTINSMELQKLDNWEDFYKRISVTLDSGVQAWAYILTKEGFKDVGHNRDMPDDIAFEGSGFQE